MSCARRRVTAESCADEAASVSARRPPAFSNSRPPARSAAEVSPNSAKNVARVRDPRDWEEQIVGDRPILFVEQRVFITLATSDRKGGALAEAKPRAYSERLLLMLEVIVRPPLEAEQKIADRMQRRGLARLVRAEHDMEACAGLKLQGAVGKGAIAFEMETLDPHASPRRLERRPRRRSRASSASAEAFARHRPAQFARRFLVDRSEKLGENPLEFRLGRNPCDQRLDVQRVGFVKRARILCRRAGLDL